LLRIQLLVNTNKVLVEMSAIDDIEKFKRDYDRVNSIIQVNALQGIRVEQLSGTIQEQYHIINAALDRIQRLLGINDSFLGMAYASDSGRKVKLQQNASLVALRYFTTKIEFMFKIIGRTMVKLMKQYYRAEQVIRVTDPIVGERWVRMNEPALAPTGRVLPDGTPEMDIVVTEAIDPETGEPEEDDDGNIILVPQNFADSDISATDVDIEITSAAYNDTDDIDRLMLESLLQGMPGQTLLQANPSAYFRAVAIGVKQLKSRYSEEIADAFLQTAQMLAPAPMADPRMMQQQQGQNQAPGLNQLAHAIGSDNDYQPQGYNQPQ